MLSIFQNIFKKAMTEMIYRAASFQTNVKNVSEGRKGHHGKFYNINRKNLLHEHDHFSLTSQLHSV